MRPESQRFTTRGERFGVEVGNKTFMGGKTREKLRVEVATMIDRMTQWLKDYEALKATLDELDRESPEKET